MPPERSFRERFCAYHQCADELFIPLVLKKCLYWPWNTALAPKIFSAAFETDRRIIAQLGLATSMTNLTAEIAGIKGDYRRVNDFRFSRRFLKRRLCRESVAAIARQVWSRQ